MTSRPSTAAPILTTIAILLPLLLFGLYVGGYFWLGQSCVVQPITFVGDEEIILPEHPGRQFKSRSLAMLYGPMGRIESLLRGVDLEVLSPD